MGKMHVGFDSGEELDSAVTNGGSQERAPALCSGTSVTTMPSSRTLGCLPGSTISQRVGLLHTALSERLVRQQTRWTASNGNARLCALHVLLCCCFCRAEPWVACLGRQSRKGWACCAPPSPRGWCGSRHAGLPATGMHACLHRMSYFTATFVLSWAGRVSARGRVTSTS